MQRAPDGRAPVAAQRGVVAPLERARERRFQPLARLLEALDGAVGSLAREPLEAPPQALDPRPVGGPRRPPRAPRGLLLPARRERRDGVRREKAEAADALEESPIGLELRLAGEGARDAPGPARDGAPPERARRDADVVERMAELPKRIGLPALGRLARRLERLAAGLPDGSAFLHGALL